MPPTCTPEKKNEYQNEQVPSECNELYFTTKDFNVEDDTNLHNSNLDNADQINMLVRIFPDLDRHFTLHKQVGYGTFSTVYLASLKTNKKKQFAIKHIVPTCHPHRIMFELKCLKQIGGVANIAGINLCLRNRNDVALIMPYQAHDFFNDYVGLMDIKETAYYMKNLLIALERVHSFAIVHRDVKPSNFLYNRKNKQFMLVDFGLAHSVCENKESPEKKRKYPISSLITDDVTQCLKKFASSSTPIQTSSASQKENDPNSKAKELKANCYVPKVKHGNISQSMRRSEMIITQPLRGEPLKNDDKSVSCRCYGRPKVCNACFTKKSLKALRAGTPGFRPPEVLLKSSEQNTAVDIWAAGIIMLSILSNCYTFFTSPDDMTALAEIIMVFGYEEVKRIAGLLGRYLICSEQCPPLDLRKVCCTLRAREKIATLITNNDACNECKQPSIACLCVGIQLNEQIPDEFTADAYNLLSKLLDINMKTRITAGEALKHPFFRNI